MRQTRLGRSSTWALIASISLPLLACGESEPTATTRPVDPAGVWTFDILVTLATGVCAGEEGEGGANPITITTSGDGPPYSVSASGFLGEPSNVLTGTFDANNRLLISGSYPEDGGITSPTHDLVATTPNRMEGTETWNWTGQSGSCPNSMSTVTATRIQ